MLYPGRVERRTPPAIVILGQLQVVALAVRTAQNPEALKRTMERNGTLRALEASLLEAKVFAKIMADMHITDIIVSEDTAVSQA